MPSGLVAAGLRGLTLGVVLALLSPAGAAQVGQAAPEITGSSWINSPALSLSALRGRVVLVEFWTYG